MSSTEEPPLAGDSDSVEQLLVAVNDNDPTAERPSEATHLYVSLLSRTEIEKLLAARERYEADCPNLLISDWSVKNYRSERILF